MPSSLAMRLGGLLALAGVAALLVVAAIPWLASTQIVRDRIALEMSIWSGYRVELGAAPDIQIWPVFRARLTHVALWEWEGADEQPAIEAEQIEVDLSALAALRGDVVFNNLRLVRPSIRIARRGLDLSLPPSEGRLARAVLAARMLVGADPSNPDLSRLPADPVGVLEIADGRLVVREDGADAEVMTSFNGKVNWAALNRPASVAFSGIWRGEMVTGELSSAQPLVLFAGGTAPVTLTLRSAPLDLAFDGRMSLSDEAFFDGGIRLSAPSLRRMLEWSRADIATATAIGAISLQAQVNGTAQRLRLNEATLSLDGNPGTGTLDVSLSGPLPSIAGTLAFESIDLGSLLAAFSNVTPQSWASSGPVDNGLSEKLSVDLRLSARRATAGSLALADVAATAQVRPALAAFDISDAAALGGRVQAGIRMDGVSGGSQVEVRIRGEELDTALLARAVGAGPPLPAARANIGVSLKGTGRNWQEVLASAEGTFGGVLGAGTVSGIDLARFIEMSSQGEFFPLREVGNGSLSFQRLEFSSAIERGILLLDRMTIASGERVITLSGIVPLPGMALALQGSVASAGPQAEEGRGDETDEAAGGGEPAMRFFVGGSWEAPFISPILPHYFGP